jgi:hypothetical protein
MSSSFDASIPVLTEVLEDEPASMPASMSSATPTIGDAPQAADDSAPPATQAAQATQADHAPQLSPAAQSSAGAAPAGPAGLDEAALAALEQRLAERILQQLQGRIDFVLEQRIKDSLAEVLDHALRDLTGEIRAGLQLTLEKVVARAVSQELAHLQVHKK